MTIKVELRLPTVPYAYAHVTVEGETELEVRAQLATLGAVTAKAISMAGGGDSAALAEMLLKQELGAVVVETIPAPAQAAIAPPTPPWAAGPPAESAGPPPFGAPAPVSADPFAALNSGAAAVPAGGEYYTVDMPANLRDDWSPKDSNGGYIKGGGVKGMIDQALGRDGTKWLADKKRWGVRRDLPQNMVDALRQRGYTLS